MITDGIGQEIHVGDIVAYNYSGELRIGVVADIVYKYRPEYYRPLVVRFVGHVDIENKRDNVTSRVKNHKSIIVLNKNLLS